MNYAIQFALRVRINQQDSVIRFSARDQIVKIPLSDFHLGALLRELGALVEPGINLELSPPWDLLNHIHFDHFFLEFNLATKEFGIRYNLNARFFFLDLEAIEIWCCKTKRGKKTVQIYLYGNFLGKSYRDTPLTWDALNGQAPQVPGAGSSAFRLDYLGLGQHVALPPGPGDTVSQVVNRLGKALPVATTETKPTALMGKLTFDTHADWLIGAKLMLLKTFTLAFIFNDPSLYGLQVEVDGPKLPELKGLKFSILYKKINAHLGCYSMKVVPPNSIRYLEFGEVSITLPVIGVDIYTDGEFHLDFGFPSGESFANAFRVEVFPFIGSGGFYVSSLKGNTAHHLPKVRNGQFSKVLEAGLALQVGIGKTLHKGPLSGGVLVTVNGKFQGVLAWFSPFHGTDGKDLFYALQASIAIVGRVYGELNFSVIKAKISASASLSATVTYACHQPMHIKAEVKVEAKLSVTIAFITLHFHFKLDLTERFTIGHASQAPWQIDGSVQPFGAEIVEQASIGVNHNHLETGWPSRWPVLQLANSPETLPLLCHACVSRGYLADAQGRFANQPVAIAMLYIAHTGFPAATRNSCGFTQLSFVLFAALYLAKYPLGQPLDEASLNDLPIGRQALENLAGDLRSAVPPLFQVNSLMAFLKAHFQIELVQFGPNDTLPSARYSYFPAFPDLMIGLDQQMPTSLDQVTPISAHYLDQIHHYFDGYEEQSVTKSPLPDQAANSVAGLAFSDYFVMLAKSLVQHGLDQFTKWPLVTTDESIQDLLRRFYDDDTGALPHLVHANQSLLYWAAPLTLTGIRQSAGTSLEKMATSFCPADSEAFQCDLANGNQAVPGLFSVGPLPMDFWFSAPPPLTLERLYQQFGVVRDDLTIFAADPHPERSTPLKPGTTILVKGAWLYLDQAVTFVNLAARFTLSVHALETLNPALDPNQPIAADHIVALPEFELRVLPSTRSEIKDYFHPAKIVHTTDNNRYRVTCRYQLGRETSLQQLCRYFGLPLPQLVPHVAAYPLNRENILNIPTFQHKSETSLADLARTYQMDPLTLVKQNLAVQLRTKCALVLPDVARVPFAELWSALKMNHQITNVAGLMSRFMLHGMRLPTLEDPNETLPLFQLIGQQHPIPTACRQLQLGWGGQSLTLSLTHDENLSTLPAPTATLHSLPLYRELPARFALKLHLALRQPQKRGPDTASTLFFLPPTLLQRVPIDQPYPLNLLAKNTSGKGLQSINATTATYLDLVVKPIKQADGSFLQNTFAMVGTNATGLTLLERLLCQMGSSSFNPLTLSLLIPQQGKQVLALSATSTIFAIKTNLQKELPNAWLIPSDSMKPTTNGDQTRAPLAATLEQSEDFLSLLWECNHVAPTGYFLHVASGLPPGLFSGTKPARLGLLIQSGTSTQSPILSADQNALLTNYQMVPGQDNLIAEPVLPKASATGTLPEALDQFCVQTGVQVSLAQLIQANLDRVGLVTRMDQQPVDPNTSLRTLMQETYGDLGSLINMFSSPTYFTLAEAYWQLYPDTLIKQAIAPPGMVGFDLKSADPSIDQQLQALYNLVAYRVAPSADFQPRGHALPVSPLRHDESVPDSIRHYQALIPAASFATDKTTQVMPYSGVGKTVALELAFRDMFGNELDTISAHHSPSSSWHFSLECPLGYYDDLLGPGQWPGLDSSYQLAGKSENTQGEASLHLLWALSPSRFLPSGDHPLDTIKSRAKQASATYERVAAQLSQPDITVSIRSTLAQGQVMYLATEKLLDYITRAHHFLTRLEQLEPVTRAPHPADSLHWTAARYGVMVGDLGLANADHPLVPGKTLTLRHVHHFPFGQTLEHMAAQCPSLERFVIINRTALLTPHRTLSVNGSPYSVTPGDTPASLIERVGAGLTYGHLANENAQDPHFFEQGQQLVSSEIELTTKAGDSLTRLLGDQAKGDQEEIGDFCRRNGTSLFFTGDTPITIPCRARLGELPFSSANQTAASLTLLAAEAPCPVLLLAEANRTILGLLVVGAQVTWQTTNLELDPESSLEGLYLTIRAIDPQVTFAQMIQSICDQAIFAAEGPWLIPPRSAVTLAIKPDYPGPIFQVQVELIIERCRDLVNPGFHNTPSVYHHVSAISPDYGPDHKQLTAFAQHFESALPGLKLAHGGNQSHGIPKTLWAVQWGRPHGYHFEFFDTIRFFSIRPLATRLMSRDRVSIPTWVEHFPDMESSPEGDPAETQDQATVTTQSFHQVDLNSWGNAFLETLDRFLEPAHLVAAYQIAPGAVNDILHAKRKLAEILSKQVIPLVPDTNEGSPPKAHTAIQAAYRDQFLISLASTYQYNVGALAHLHLHTPEPRADQADSSAPNLRVHTTVGRTGQRDTPTVTPDGEVAKHHSLISVHDSHFFTDSTSTSLPLLIDTHLETATSSIALDLSMDIRAFDYHFETVPRLPDYPAYAPMVFIIPIQRSLGRQKIPAPMLHFPATPHLLNQSAQPAYPQTSQLSKASEWRYSASVAHDRIAQDTLAVAFEFNRERDQDENNDIHRHSDLFDQLAIFQCLRERLMAAFTHSDPSHQLSKPALDQFVELVQEIVTAWQAWPQRRHQFLTFAPRTVFLKEALDQNHQLQLSLYAHRANTLPSGSSLTLTFKGYQPYAGHAFTLPAGTTERMTGIFQPLNAKQHAAETLETELKLSGLNVAGAENGRAVFTILRNFQLPDLGPIDPAFIFQTPPVSFIEMATPHLDNQQPILLSTAISGPVARKTFFETQLHTLFRRVFAEQTFPDERSYSIRITAGYGFELFPRQKESQDDVPLAVLPISLQPMTLKGSAGGAAPLTFSGFAELIDHLDDWFNTRQPTTARGYLVIGLTMFGTHPPHPILLDLGNLRIPLDFDS